MIDIGDTTGFPDYIEKVRVCCWQHNFTDLVVPTITLRPEWRQFMCDGVLYTLRIMQATCPRCGEQWQGWDWSITQWPK